LTVDLDEAAARRVVRLGAAGLSLHEHCAGGQHGRCTQQPGQGAGAARAGRLQGLRHRVILLDLSPLPGKKAGRSLAFGPQTWPHLLARALLTEQIYRAITILAGHPYHRA